jgi:hypothetical protein
VFTYQLLCVYRMSLHFCLIIADFCLRGMCIIYARRLLSRNHGRRCTNEKLIGTHQGMNGESEMMIWFFPEFSERDNSIVSFQNRFYPPELKEEKWRENSWHIKHHRFISPGEVLPHGFKCLKTSDTSGDVIFLNMNHWFLKPVALCYYWSLFSWAKIL